MAKSNRGKQYYEITKEKPFSPFHMLLVGGAVGVLVSFFLILLVGDFEEIPLDSLLFAVLLGGFLGFGLGALLTWLFVRVFSGVFQFPSGGPLGNKTPVPVGGEAPSPVVEDEKEKGKSVDYVFPELSPDK